MSIQITAPVHYVMYQFFCMISHFWVEVRTKIFFRQLSQRTNKWGNPLKNNWPIRDSCCIDLCTKTMANLRTANRSIIASRHQDQLRLELKHTQHQTNSWPEQPNQKWQSLYHSTNSVSAEHFRPMLYNGCTTKSDIQMSLYICTTCSEQNLTSSSHWLLLILLHPFGFSVVPLTLYMLNSVKLH
jgi:hypothetical protein